MEFVKGSMSEICFTFSFNNVFSPSDNSYQKKVAFENSPTHNITIFLEGSIKYQVEFVLQNLTAKNVYKKMKFENVC